MFIFINELTLIYLNFISRHTEFGQSWIKTDCDANIANVKSPY